jgi:hypothetical protein
MADHATIEPLTWEDPVAQAINELVEHLNTNVAPLLRWAATGRPMREYIASPHGKKWICIVSLCTRAEGGYHEGSTVFCYVDHRTGEVYKGRQWRAPNKDDQMYYRLLDDASRRRLYEAAKKGIEFPREAWIPKGRRRG